MTQILIVEDERLINELIRMSLCGAGLRLYLRVSTATRRWEALDRQAFDLVLLDVMLPGVDGFSLMEYIRPLDIPVIFLTARASVQDPRVWAKARRGRLPRKAL